jgi:hypothetical protein
VWTKSRLLIVKTGCTYSYHYALKVTHNETFELEMSPYLLNVKKISKHVPPSPENTTYLKKKLVLRRF